MRGAQARLDRTETVRDGGAGRESRGREVAGIVLLGLGLFIGLSVISLQLGTGTLMGPCGATVGLGVYALFGVGSYLVAFAIGAVALSCLQGKAIRWKSIETVAAVGIGLSAAILFHLLFGSHRLRGFAPGGLIGEYSAELMTSVVGRVGTALFGVTMLAASLVLATPITFRSIPSHLMTGLKMAWSGLLRAIAYIFPEHDEEAEEEEATAEREDTVETELEREAKELKAEKESKISITPPKEAISAAKTARRKRDDEAQVLRTAENKKEDGAPSIVVPEKSGQAYEAFEVLEDKPVEAPTPKIVVPAILAPKIVEPVAMMKKEIDIKKPEKPEKKEHKPDFIPAAGGYHLPDLSLLDFESQGDPDFDKAAMLALADRLQTSLQTYGVDGQVIEIHPGPVVTMYEFVPAPGVKISKIASLSNDLAMNLAAVRVRIVAPIPGKGSVGIEVPNKRRATVYMKEILVDEGVQKAKSKLTMGLGKDIAGQPVAVDLAKMPHLLVAGTTGSGKSVSLNGMICSILFNSTPEEVRMIMIDPKMVELSIYEGIPHLLLPVVTDPKKANLALRWAVDEMERRYDLVSKTGLRDILSYNKRMEKLIADGPPKKEDKKISIFVEGDDGPDGAKVRREIEVSADEDAVKKAGGTITDEVREEISQAVAAMQKAQLEFEAPRKLPYIVVIIDEFADLMMVAAKEVETSVARIAQKARAVGIHLILATQRPSVDVITGLIKANFPSRVAFQVASKIDSRTILDQQGAENLLGQGDMLFTDRGQSLRRIHGALVTDTEIKRLVDYLKEQGKPVYDMDILKPREEEDSEGGEGGGEMSSPSADPMYDSAVRLVCETRLASVSMIQRRLQVGFNRAARMVERMEKDGIVGAPNGSKPREVIANAL